MTTYDPRTGNLEYSPFSATQPQPRMHLQGIGKVPAKPAEELRPGDLLMWNYGTTSTVLSVQRVGEQSVRVVEQYDGDKRYARTFRRDRLVYDDGRRR